MGLFSRKPSAPRAGAIIDIPPSGDVYVTGTNYHGREVRRVPRGESRFELVREPQNPYDRNAVSVRFRGGVVGYIDADRAVDYAPVLDTSGLVPRVVGHKTGKDNIRVALPASDELDVFLCAARGVQSPRSLVPLVRVVRPWAASKVLHEIADEREYPLAFRSLFAGHSNMAEGQERYDLKAVLQPTVDGKTVAVIVEGHRVGRLESATFATWGRTVHANAIRGGVGIEAPARVWARFDGPLVYARVTVSLPESTNGLLPANPMPTGPVVLIPTGKAIQVTGEEQHLDVLAPWVAGGREPWVAVTLHSLDEQRARSVVPTVEVRLDGQRVGVLTPASTANVRPLVEHAEARGQIAVARAVIKGNHLKADVTLHVAKASEVEARWFASPAATE